MVNLLNEDYFLDSLELNDYIEIKLNNKPPAIRGHIVGIDKYNKGRDRDWLQILRDDGVSGGGVRLSVDEEGSEQNAWIVFPLTDKIKIITKARKQLYDDFGYIYYEESNK